MTQPMPSFSPKLIGRACDACRKAKIKCKLIKNSHCESCSKKGKLCTFLTIPKKRGPKPKLHSQFSECCEPNQQFTPPSPTTTEPSSPLLQPTSPLYSTFESTIYPEHLSIFMSELNPHVEFFTLSALNTRLNQTPSISFNFLLRCIEVCTFVWTLPPPYSVHPLSYLTSHYQEYCNLMQSGITLDVIDMNQSIYLLDFIQQYSLTVCGPPHQFVPELTMAISTNSEQN